MRRLIPFVLFAVACTATAPVPEPATSPAPVAATEGPAPQCNPGHSILNATLYVQSSAEYRAAARQTFAAARRALDEALADPTRVGALEDANEDPSQPPAVIVDVDETVLDNTPFEARVIRAGMTYDTAMWKAWTAEGAAPAIPGALDFLNYAKSKGVAVFYITNRDEDERPGTRSNLQRLGFPLEERRETLLLRTSTSDKAPRRREVGKVFRILLLVGDDLNDFAPMREASWADRNALIEKQADWWGTRWFMIPNPMYGSWERAAIGQGGTPCEQLGRKIDALQP